MILVLATMTKMKNENVETEVIEGLRAKKEALFIDLIRELDTIDADVRFRISSIEPNLCTEEIIDFVCAPQPRMQSWSITLNDLKISPY